MTIVRTFDPARGQFLLGFSGRAGAGKDTCAELLLTQGFRRVAFADALREEVASAWRFNLSMLTDRATKEWPIPALAIANCSDAGFVETMERRGEDLVAPRSARWILQRWGTEYRRAVNDNYWIDQALTRIGRMRASGCHRICITDVRFANEASAIDALGGKVVQLVRPDLPALARDAAGHPSEAGALPSAAAVHNDGNFEQLQLELARVIEALGWRWL